MRRSRGFRILMSRVALVAVAAIVVSSLVAGCELRDSLEFSPTTLPDGQVGTPYTATVTVLHAATPVGGVSPAEGSALPPGLDVNLGDEHDSTLHFVGTPTTAGTYTFTISVWCYGTNVAGQTATQPFTIVVK